MHLQPNSYHAVSSSSLLFNGAALIQLPSLITGAVVDPSGAAVPNATVRLEMSGRTVDESGQAATGDSS